MEKVLMKTYYYSGPKVTKIDPEKCPEMRAVVTIGTFIRK